MVTRHLLLGDSCCHRSNSYHSYDDNNNSSDKNRLYNMNDDNSTQFDIEKRKRNRNTPNCEIKNKNFVSTFRISFVGILSLLAMVNAIVAVQGAAVYSNINFLTNPNFEQICSVQQEHYIESDGKESSLILEFASGVLAEKRKSCTRILSAPTNYGFIVRLILPKIRRNRHGIAAASTIAEGVVGTATSLVSTSPKTTTANDATIATATESDRLETEGGAAKRSGVPALSGMTSLIDRINATAMNTANPARSCPLAIFSSLDFHTPQWRLDPCQLEDTAPDMEDPVRLFHGRVRIVWEHGQHTLHSKLMVTALGKGDQCRNENKHQCLRIGDEPILCISKELVCDGIRHCPISNEYDSDEDYEMCWKRRRYGEPIPPAMETDIFEHFALEVFRNLFAFDVPAYGEKTTTTAITAETAQSAQEGNGSSGVVNSTTLRKVDTKQMGQTANDTNTGGNSTVAATAQAENSTESTGGHHHRRNSTRSGLNSDLSKYGPWGYLMLGMLLCGGALLICGLWASASQHATNNEREAAMQTGGAGAGSDLQSSNTAPPNYEELDPPPAYSVLFPNQKAASSTTLSSLGAAALMPPTMAAVAVTTPNGTAVTTPPGVVAATSAQTSTIAAAAAAADSSTTAVATTTTRVQLESAACSSQSH
ncbi:uncharacterized protein LOC118742526 isoform X2 [Rhagoletis pomonella]|uniref:uncharacterized protein LOC118742526 isoform X2 n=1 Tax=Rhagoletis pomonella TaxID=28610 RepID=UPI0017876B48|nr:uncharacterized protein LOC118742526 isoform X2 [Rhagoletis pomonella]